MNAIVSVGVAHADRACASAARQEDRAVSIWRANIDLTAAARASGIPSNSHPEVAVGLIEPNHSAGIGSAAQVGRFAAKFIPSRQPATITGTFQARFRQSIVAVSIDLAAAADEADCGSVCRGAI